MWRAPDFVVIPCSDPSCPFGAGQVWTGAFILPEVAIVIGHLRRYGTPALIRLGIQFAKFGVVGLLGFVADTAVVYALRSSVGLYLAGCASFAVAVSVTWWVNRVWTFRGTAYRQPAHRQWARYAIANTPGMVLNRAAYFMLVTVSALCAQHPVFAVAAGAIAGMFANFILSRSVVFR